ncbi:MAG: tRNA pseudouridine(55) synthase TruB [Pyrinomonadaceae bacterium]
MDGLLIIDKPAGITSHDVVARVRKILAQRRVGHTGTLDPFATGVLVVLVGRATRLAQFLSGEEKEYDAVVRLGYETETGDITGKAMSDATKNTISVAALNAEEIEVALRSLRGEIDQVPPMYSAKKRNGRRLYELAHRGELVSREPVRVTVHIFETVSREGQILKDNADGTADLVIHVVCSAGTYVRTLAESLGKQLRLGAHLAELRRIRAGDFHLSKAVSLEQLKEKVVEESLGTVLIPPDRALRRMPFICLNDSAEQKVRRGIDVPIEEHSDGVPTEGQTVRMRDEAGRLLAVGYYDGRNKSLHPKVVLAS